MWHERFSKRFWTLYRYSNFCWGDKKRPGVFLHIWRGSFASITKWVLLLHMQKGQRSKQQPNYRRSKAEEASDSLFLTDSLWFRTEIPLESAHIYFYAHRCILLYVIWKNKVKDQHPASQRGDKLTKGKLRPWWAEFIGQALLYFL